MPYDVAFTISMMTVSQFKAFKKGLTVLMRAGLNRDDAINSIVYSFIKTQEQVKENQKSYRETFKQFAKSSGLD